MPTIRGLGPTIVQGRYGEPRLHLIGQEWWKGCRKTAPKGVVFCQFFTGTQTLLVNTLEKAIERVDSEVARESRRQAESQGGPTIVVGTMVPTSALVMPVRPE
jgi:hypothetical protein